MAILSRSPALEKQEVLTTYTMPHGEIIAGLRAAQASISPKYFYDQQGSALFERITALPEYYPTRTEGAIMQMRGQDIKACIAAAATVIELGAGNCEKARVLCSLVQPRCFVAIDISGDFLHQAVNGLRNAFPALDIRAVVADIFDQVPLPPDLPSGQRLVFYPGSAANVNSARASASTRRTATNTACRVLRHGWSGPVSGGRRPGATRASGLRSFWPKSDGLLWSALT